MEKLKLAVDDIVAVTSESRSIIYDAIARGQLKTFLVGRRRFARPEAVREWVDWLEHESEAGRPVVYRPRKAAAA
jgi:hypothetical protein